MHFKKITIAALLAFAASASQAAVSYSKDFVFSPGGLFAFEDQLNINGPARLNFSLTPNAGLSGDLANLFGFSWKIAPTVENGTPLSLVFNPGQKTYSGSFDFNSSGRYGFLFTSAAAHNWAGKLNVTVAPIPEPETYALMGLGLLGLMAARRKKMKS